ncbi:putative quinol monooxygenase [Shimia marina]|uniref:Antibiotic biosynthesis monooxygenase n=1 Tax=Shimia marina TaxID=321267 RepID=A0A0P1ETJ4_9RHOB|nr:antibiotic biosynthesis monooxygenase [Shimia marina]CUH53385.1 Antibiotic biosynthesis monooxygenase [Shimia marina]SFD78227.1 Quinol monooxygenase YgiN [Shimia marina]
MPAPNIRLIGHINVPSHRLDAVAAALPAHIALTRAEPGCLFFDVTPDITIAGRYNVCELFVDQSAFDAHQARAAASDWADVTARIPRHYQITEVPV